MKEMYIPNKPTDTRFSKAYSCIVCPCMLVYIPPKKLYTSVIHVTIWCHNQNFTVCRRAKVDKTRYGFSTEEKTSQCLQSSGAWPYMTCFLWITGWQFFSKDTKHANLCASRSSNYKVVLEKQHKPSKVHTRLIPPPRNSGLRIAWAT